MIKYLSTLIFFIALSYSSYSQTAAFYYIIEKAEYDSLELQTWYTGRIFFRNGTQRDGWIHRNPDDPSVHYRESRNSKIISYSPIKAEGYYSIYEKDTAFFVFLDINCRKSYKKKERALRILIDDADGLSLLRLSWLEKDESKIGNLFNSNTYAIYWRYFLWKDGKLKELIFWNRDLYSILKVNQYAKDYYKRNKKHLKDDNHYTYLSNMIKIYNMTKDQNAQVVER